VGKTRLAIQVANEIEPEFVDGVSLVELAATSDPSFLLSAITRALGLEDQGLKPVTDRLVDYLRPRHMLLVLDNLEHLAEAVDGISAIVEHCPQVTILATSRITLHLSNEYEVPVRPLGVPEAVQLFVTRAKAVTPDFALTADNATTVASICERLDGLPLAIELASARLRSLSPKALLARLEPALSMLTGGNRDRPDRLRTMRNAIAWSFDLLEPIEQAIFCRLTICAGSFALEDVDAICGLLSEEGASPWSAPGFRLPPNLTMFDIVNSLVEKSLICLSPGPSKREPRYFMLETIREFGLEQLATNEEAPVRFAHAAHFLEIVERAELELDGWNPQPLLDDLEGDLPNLVAALAWCIKSDAESALRLSGSLLQFWLVRGPLGDARELLQRALVLDGGAPSSRIKATLATAWITFAQGDLVASLRLGQQALALSRDTRNDAGLAESQRVIAATYVASGRSVSPPDTHQFDLAERALGEAFELARARADLKALAEVTLGLGTLAIEQEDPPLALRRFAAALFMFAQTGSRRSMSWTRVEIGRLARNRGDIDAAGASYLSALTGFRAIDDRWSLVRMIDEAAWLAFRAERPADAIQLLAAADSCHERNGTALTSAHYPPRDRALAEARAAIGELRFTEAWASGFAMNAESALECASHLFQSLHPRQNSPDERPSGDHGLTSREQMVLEAVADGQSDRAIATGLKISTRAVREAIGGALIKLNIASPEHGTRHATDTPIGDTLTSLAPSSTGAGQNWPDGLSDREVDILRLIAEGMTNRQIADSLFLSVRTVERHVLNAYGKLNLHGRAAATAYVLRNLS
jgi:non-specific serine/threonine protein kinase